MEMKYIKSLWNRIWPQKFTRELMLQSRVDELLEGAKLIEEPAASSAVHNYGQLAREALDTGQFERGWRNILSGERIVLSLADAKQTQSRAVGLVEQAKSFLPPDEAKSVETIVNAQPKDNLHSNIIEAQHYYDITYINLNDAREKLSARLVFLTFGLVIFLILFLALLIEFNAELVGVLFSLTKPTDPIEVTMPIIAATLFLGGLGACVSAILSYTSLGKVPGAFESWMVTLARPIVGAVSGMMAIMLVQASLVDFKSGAAVGLTAFLFGFSERLIIGAVKRLEAQQKT